MTDARESTVTVSTPDAESFRKSQSVATVPARKLDLEKVVAAPGTGGGVTFLPRTMQECLDFATIMSKSDFAIPPKFRNNVGACLAVTIQACRWEADPFGVIQKAYITKSKDGSERLAYEAQVVAAVVNTRAGLAGRLQLIYSGEGVSRKLKVIGTFRDTGESREIETPRWDKIGVKNSPLWQSDPDQQFAYYGMRAWGRRWCPEILLGIYTPEDFEDAVVVDAPRPTRAQVGSAAPAPDEGIERQAVEEPAVEARATAEEILGAAQDLTAPITREEAAVIDETRETPDRRAAAHGIAGEGLDERGFDDEESLPSADVAAEVARNEWEQFLERSVAALKEGELKTESDFDEFGDRTKTTIKGATDLSDDDKDDIRARFVSALLTRKRELFGTGRRR